MVTQITRRRELLVDGINMRLFGLYMSDYRRGVGIREAARLVGVSHPALMKRLGALEEGGCLTSKETGKSRIYSLDPKSFHAKSYLAFSELYSRDRAFERNKELSLVSEEIVGSLKGPLGSKIKCLLIFGSFAKGSQTKGSDIDLFILGDFKKGSREHDESISKPLKRVSSVYGRKINANTSGSMEEALKSEGFREVIENHLILHGFEYFVDGLWRWYFDRG